MRKEVEIDATALLKFFFVALSHSKDMTITLPMIEVMSVPNSFGQYMEIEYLKREDKLRVSVKHEQKNIVIPSARQIKAMSKN